MKCAARLAVTALLLVQLGACVTWQPVTTTPDRLVQEEQPERVRVTRTDGVQLTLEAPAVRAGAIVATAAPGAVLVDDIRTMEVERVSVLRTIGLVLPAVVVVAVVALAACRC